MLRGTKKHERACRRSEGDGAPPRTTVNLDLVPLLGRRVAYLRKGAPACQEQLDNRFGVAASGL